MYFHFSYFHFQKIRPFSISQKNTTLWWEKKYEYDVRPMYDNPQHQNMYLVT
jgi:hypothetical protein